MSSYFFSDTLVANSMSVLGMGKKPTYNEGDVKSAYRKACAKYHPDRNGAASTCMMQAINVARDYLLKTLEFSDSVINKHATNEKQADDFGGDLYAVIMALIDIEGINLTMAGSWLWIDGDTKPHSKLLGKSGLGCQWNKKKMNWSYRPAGVAKSRSRGGYSMDKIKNTFGSSTIVKGEGRKAISN